jgi:hypothetical protein
MQIGARGSVINATSQKVTGSKLDEVNGFFNLPNPSVCNNP